MTPHSVTGTDSPLHNAREFDPLRDGCWTCGAPLEGRQRNTVTCSNACRMRRYRGKRQPRSARMARRWGLRPGDFWRTPPWLVAAVSLELPLSIDVSSSSEDSTCPEHVPPGDNGLEAEWSPQTPGAAWWNPPYSPGLLPWMEKARDEHRRGVSSVGLIPPAMGARYMVLAHQEATAIRYIKGRVPFLHPDTGRAVAGNRGDSCLIFFLGGISLAQAEVGYVELNELREQGLRALAERPSVPDMFPSQVSHHTGGPYSSGIQENSCCSPWNRAGCGDGAKNPNSAPYRPILRLPKRLQARVSA